MIDRQTVRRCRGCRRFRRGFSGCDPNPGKHFGNGILAHTFPTAKLSVLRNPIGPSANYPHSAILIHPKHREFSASKVADQGPQGPTEVIGTWSPSRAALAWLPEADADLLIDQLLLNPDGDLYWKKWSNDHPKLAAVLWPVIQKLAERELYILMPRLFEFAQPDQSPADLQASIDAYLVEQYRGLIADMVAADRIELAQTACRRGAGRLSRPA